MTFICEPHTAGCLGAAALCTSLKASPSYWSPHSFCLIWPQLLLGPDYSLTCLLAYESWSAQKSERTVCTYTVWGQRKRTTREPLSQHKAWEPSEVGGMRGILCLRNEGQSSQRESVCNLLREHMYATLWTRITMAPFTLSWICK